MTTLSNSEIISVVVDVAELKGIKTTLSGVARGTAIVSTITAAGGLFGGPVGLSIGGIIGSILALMDGQGQYKPLVEVIMEEMSPEQKNRLANELVNFFSEIQVTSAVAMIGMIMSDENLQTTLLQQVGSFLSSETGRQILM